MTPSPRDFANRIPAPIIRRPVFGCLRVKRRKIAQIGPSGPIAGACNCWAKVSLRRAERPSVRGAGFGPGKTWSGILGLDLHPGFHRRGKVANSVGYECCRFSSVTWLWE